MGYDNHFTGAITITPPLTRTQIRNSQIERMTDVRLRIVEQEIEADDGESVTVRQTADAIVPLDMAYSGHNLVEEIQFLVDAFSEHEFAGYIEAQWDPGFESPPSRFIVQDGRVVQIDAQYRWPGEPRIVCLCGSSRFRAEHDAVNCDLTMAGAIVLGLGAFSHADGVPITDAEKAALDALHLAKIKLADEVFVVNPGGYIGPSTANEIAYATKTGKPVRYLEAPK